MFGVAALSSSGFRWSQYNSLVEIALLFLVLPYAVGWTAVRAGEWVRQGFLPSSQTTNATSPSSRAESLWQRTAFGRKYFITVATALAGAAAIAWLGGVVFNVVYVLTH